MSEKFINTGLNMSAYTEVIPTISRAIDAEAEARVKLLGTLPGDVSRVWAERVRRAHRAFRREDD